MFLMRSHKAICVVVLWSLFVLAVTSLLSMLGDVYSYQAKRFEIRWEHGGAEVTIDDWRQSKKYLLAALSVHGNPDYQQSLGRLYSWEFFVGGHTVDVVSSRSGIQAFERAMLKRPYWARGWSQLAVLKSLGGEVDETFWHAYSSALKTGPWEVSVMFNLLGAGAGAWNGLSQSQKTEVLRLFQRIVSIDVDFARRANRIAEVYRMKSLFCSAVIRRDVPAYAKTLCSQ